MRNLLPYHKSRLQVDLYILAFVWRNGIILRNLLDGFFIQSGSVCSRDSVGRVCACVCVCVCVCCVCDAAHNRMVKAEYLHQSCLGSNSEDAHQ